MFKFKFKRIFTIFLIVLVCLVFISFVNAQNINENSKNDNFKLISQQTPISNRGCENFTYLNDKIVNSDSNNEIKLDTDIKLNKGLNAGNEQDIFKDGINISKTVVIDGQNHIINGTDSIHHVRIFNVNSEGNLTLKNIILSEGYHNIEGGAILVQEGGLLTLMNVTFIKNVAYNGGAIYTNGDLDIAFNNTFLYNAADYGKGGVIYSKKGSVRCSGNDSFFFYNRARNKGGVIDCENGDVVISGNNIEFSNNLAGNDGGVINYKSGNVIIFGDNISFINNFAETSNGGVINCEGSNTNIIVSGKNTLFYHNYAFKNGGVINGDKSNVAIYGNNSSFINNGANGKGGCIYSKNTTIFSNNSKFINNSATKDGGVIDYYSTGATLTKIYGNNLLFANNTAKSAGGAIRCKGIEISGNNISFINNTAYSEGGAILSKSGDVTLLADNITFLNNRAINNYAYGGAIYSRASKILGNNIIFKNNSAIGQNSEGGAIYSDKNNITISANNTKFLNNNATKGGAIYALSVNSENTLFINNSAQIGGAIFIRLSGNSNINFNVFLYNSGKNGSCVFVESNGQGIVNLNDNWWGSNENISSLVEGINYNLSEWAVAKVISDDIKVGDTIKLNILFKSSNGGNLSKAIPNRLVNIISNGATFGNGLSNITVDLINNSIIVVGTADKKGNISITIDLENFLLNISQIKTKILGNDLIVKYGDIIRYNVTLIGENSPIGGVNIDLMLNNKEYAAVTNKKGIAIFIINEGLAAGNYTLIYSFKGNENMRHHQIVQF